MNETKYMRSHNRKDFEEKIMKKKKTKTKMYIEQNHSTFNRKVCHDKMNKDHQ